MQALDGQSQPLPLLFSPDIQVTDQTGSVL